MPVAPWDRAMPSKVRLRIERSLSDHRRDHEQQSHDEEDGRVFTIRARREQTIPSAHDSAERRDETESPHAREEKRAREPGSEHAGCRAAACADAEAQPEV